VSKIIYCNCPGCGENHKIERPFGDLENRYSTAYKQYCSKCKKRSESLKMMNEVTSSIPELINKFSDMRDSFERFDDNNVFWEEDDGVVGMPDVSDSMTIRQFAEKNREEIETPSLLWLG